MQHGKKPTKNQKIFIKEKNLNPDNWLVERDTPTEMVIINRQSKNPKTLKK